MAAVAVAVVTLGTVASTWRPAAAQGQRSEDVLPALLVEVRGLRAAMEQMASGGAQAQLLVGRLQLQEGRITSMVRRLDTVRDSLVEARAASSQLQGTMQMLTRGEGPDANLPQNEKNDMLAGFKVQVTAAKANVERLAAEEMQLSADIAAEQQRWIAINQRLDDLERSLAKR
jgi:hypothetical protein